MNILLDLGRFKMIYFGKTAHAGAASGNQKKYVQTRLYNGNAISVDDKIDASARDADNYTIRNWLGLLSGGARTNIIIRICMAE